MGLKDKLCHVFAQNRALRPDVDLKTVSRTSMTYGRSPVYPPQPRTIEFLKAASSRLGHADPISNRHATYAFPFRRTNFAGICVIFFRDIGATCMPAGGRCPCGVRLCL